MDKSKWAVAIVLASTLLTSSGQILLKMGSGNLSLDLIAQLSNLPLLAGWFLYIVGAVMLIVALKYGDLSVLYPIYSLNFVWVSILSPYIFATDSMNTVKWAGVVVVVLGVSCVGIGSARAAARQREAGR
ncbi:MAG: hypothetical protein PHG85_01045 [Candidatus Altiarchaeota archaeon]|nr:hypothetical protein [Candidatus Altiarchaeota archaeon]